VGPLEDLGDSSIEVLEAIERTTTRNRGERNFEVMNKMGIHFKLLSLGAGLV
jgi:hypothetical protein